MECPASLTENLVSQSPRALKSLESQGFPLQPETRPYPRIRHHNKECTWQQNYYHTRLGKVFKAHQTGQYMPMQLSRGYDPCWSCKTSQH